VRSVVSKKSEAARLSAVDGALFVAQGILPDQTEYVISRILPRPIFAVTPVGYSIDD
jgi:hypothetical protein